MRTVLAAVLSLTLAACGSGPPPRHQACMPEVGMTTELLSKCGCVLNDSGGLASASAAWQQTEPNVQTVIIVNYICPRGELGTALVSVVNGVADAVYY